MFSAVGNSCDSFRDLILMLLLILFFKIESHYAGWAGFEVIMRLKLKLPAILLLSLLKAGIAGMSHHTLLGALIIIKYLTAFSFVFTERRFFWIWGVHDFSNPRISIVSFPQNGYLLYFFYSGCNVQLIRML